jgi:hypothetical protein
MEQNKASVDTLKDIKQMMERSSRFISLSGWSGISAGVCALIGAWFAHQAISLNRQSIVVDGGNDSRTYDSAAINSSLGTTLIVIAILTFIAAFITAFIFTYIRSRKNNTPIWSHASRRLMINVVIPMIVGGIFLFRLIQFNYFGLIAPGCLIFYGLALLNGSKYTLSEIRYLGYCELILGLLSCWFIGYGLLFWAIGFGLMHIIYGTMMWYNYERKG